ncbi:hypothetical protein AKJ56_01985 [candidate division MSBL1 archaeon SCGC-AAA382N08]|uniref:Aldehyde ferredoxin oxidoreductase N-terminal domain-containing protein n=1 Tax=candidate division MSBL1 archaeon SCGC-AAA382N08 TaxID=1698285 RepID=A0A133VNM6_9EURY|nr:hypothetical protein AKJ56_01985 [candidate division MSBL1 archaeon SCGC-AAA382N08]
MYGWMGKSLWVDLSKEKIVEKELDRKLVKKYIGGRGINSKLLFDHLDPGVGPLSPRNELIISSGPCNGTIVPGSTRFTITAKSPLSGFLGDSNSGGSFGVEMKYAGYDFIVIKGKAEKPSLLLINDDEVLLKNAEHLWGLKIGDTRRVIERELGDPDIKLISIGPAGENLVKFAAIIADIGRAHGRCGMGAVMGSKNLKAVGVRGSQGVKVSNPDLLKKTVEKMKRLYKDSEDWYENMRKYGPTRLPMSYNKWGSLPTRNYQTGTMDGTENISGEAFRNNYFVSERSCFSCPIGCQAYWVFEGGINNFTEGLENEDPTMYGSRLGVKNSNSILKMHELSNEYGLDIADTSGVISFLIECVEKGIVDESDIGLEDLTWGDFEKVLSLIKMIAEREGIGDILAEGQKKSAEFFGEESKKYTIQVKNLTLDASDPRAFKGWGLGYAVSSRGAEHCRTLFAEEREMGGLTEKDKADRIVFHENIRAVQNSLEICEFCSYLGKMMSPEILSDFYKSVTGFEINKTELEKIGERIVNVERAFNLREGLTKEDDTLPTRFLKEPMPSGNAKGQTVDLESMLNRYYNLRDWDENTGFPKAEKFEELGLEKMNSELEEVRRDRSR